MSYSKFTQGGEDAYDVSSCGFLFAKELCMIGLFCRKRPMQIKHPMRLRHPLLPARIFCILTVGFGIDTHITYIYIDIHIYIYVYIYIES